MSLFAVLKRAIRKQPLKIGLASLCIMIFIGLQVWEYSAPLSVHDWNKEEISRIKVPGSEHFAFTVLGDNKGNSSIFEPLLRDVDHDMEITFAIDVGDLVRKGGKGLYRKLINQVRQNLAIPFLTAIGNHDLNGSSGNYRTIFGPTYYSFQVGQSYFIVLEAITEAGFDSIERQWLERELQKAQTFKTRFVFMHVPPFDPRGKGFNKCLPETEGKDLLSLFKRYDVTHLFASHLHGYFSGVWEGVPYTITGGAGGKLQGSDPEHFFHHYVKVRVYGGSVDTVARRIDSEGIRARLFDMIRDYPIDWGLLLGAGLFLFIAALPTRNRCNSAPRRGPYQSLPVGDRKNSRVNQ